MSEASVLELSEANARFRLEEALSYADAEGDLGARARATATASHRTLGICNLLRYASVDGFACALAKAGDARLDQLHRAFTTGSCPPALLCSGNDLGFTAAVAAGAEATAAAIAELAPTEALRDVEYEDDFLWQRTLQLLLLGRDDEVRGAVERWRTLLDGEPSGQLDACTAVLDGDEDAFRDGFAHLLRQRTAQLERYRTSLTFSAERFATEGRIYVDGLAVLRLAEARGVRMRESAEMVPELARVPRGLRLPARGSWRLVDPLS